MPVVQRLNDPPPDLLFPGSSVSPASSCSESVDCSAGLVVSGAGGATFPLVPFTSCGLVICPGTSRDERFTCQTNRELSQVIHDHIL